VMIDGVWIRLDVRSESWIDSVGERRLVAPLRLSGSKDPGIFLSIMMSSIEVETPTKMNYRVKVYVETNS
jgi:hypothetical protein